MNGGIVAGKHESGNVWWGDFTLSENTPGVFRIGPAVLHVSRLPGEWRIVYDADTMETDEGNDIHIDVQSAAPVELSRRAVVNRYGMSTGGSSIRLTPALADRHVVVQSETPFHIMPGQNMTYYVSTPLWVAFHTGKPSVKMTEMPLFRPSDTWFGPSTIQGELCYASTTSGRLRLDDIRFRPHRAVTVVLLKNLTGNPVLLKSLSLPVPNLSLYESADGYLWTQPVKLEMTENNDAAEMSLKQRAPSEAVKAKLVCEPRVKAVNNILTQAMSRLIK